MKKLLFRAALGIGTLGVVASGAAAFSAFEAHIINVTATIENALNVPIEANGLTFGTVFPQEQLDQQFDVNFSESFAQQIRVNAVDYAIKQKPKCVLVTPNSGLPQYSTVTEDASGHFVCVDEENYDILPLLCPYLSKHESTGDGTAVENDPDPDQVAFHGPLTDWTLDDTNFYQVKGRLDQSVSDTNDKWVIDLKAPCFQGQCDQGWASFVTEINGQAIAANYIQPKENEHKLFGCDLWLEATGINTPVL